MSGGCVVYYDPRSNPSDLQLYLKDLVSKRVGFELAIAFKSRTVFNGFQQDGNNKMKCSFNKKKKDEGYKVFHS